MTRYWLMKAEPNSRIVKGNDVKVCSSLTYMALHLTKALFASQFSIEDFEQVGTTAWEGVRNPEARNLMKEMQVGDKVRLGLVICPTDIYLDTSGLILSL
jgi:predicted RNA-binding protein with PUA-like domain